MRDRDEAIESFRDRKPGSEKDPYENVDISTLPPWWQRGIHEHRTFGLRPYRPPRFSDGAVTVFLIDTLESELGVTIKLYGESVESSDAWTIEMEDEPVGTIDHFRDPEGYSVFNMTSEAFEELIRSTHLRTSNDCCGDRSENV